MASGIKDIGEIWSRLFDHRPFIQGEVTYFVRELEERRGDREVERLFKILEYSTELGQSQIDRGVQLGDCYLPSLKANTDVALSMSDRIVNREGRTKTDQQLAREQELRDKDWDVFIRHINDKYRQASLAFSKREGELKAFYADLEEKLHITQ